MPLFHFSRDVTQKFEPHIANVDLISVVVNAEIKVDYTRHILMTLKQTQNALSLSIDS